MSALAAAPPQKDRRKDSLLRIATVRARTGLSAATIYRREAAGTFPQRVHIGARSVAWYESDIDDFVECGGRYVANDQSAGAAALN